MKSPSSSGYSATEIFPFFDEKLFYSVLRTYEKRFVTAILEKERTLKIYWQKKFYFQKLDFDWV